MDEYLKKVMVEYDCPECGGARLKRARRLVTIDGRNLYEVGEMHLADLLAFLKSIKPTARQRAIAETIVREVATRLELLIAIGLDYLSLNRRSATLSGGESQRIRLSSQIGSGLMGMLYVLDEPSIGLHPKDNVKMIETLQAAARPGQHGDRRRARRRHDSRGGSHPRNRPRPGRARRQGRRRGAA